jgi:hypothetical protein
LEKAVEKYAKSDEKKKLELKHKWAIIEDWCTSVYRWYNNKKKEKIDKDRERILRKWRNNVICINENWGNWSGYYLRDIKRSKNLSS